MKTLTAKILRLALLVATMCFYTQSHAQITNTWDGGGADGLWNTDLNWSLDLTPGTGTNAFIDFGAVTVNYNSPMTATDFSTLRTAAGTILNINAGGFVSSAATNGAISIVGAGSQLLINSGGAVSTTAGGLTGETNAAVVIYPGGSLNVAGAMRIGNLGGSSPGSFFTNFGGTLSAASTTINPGNSASTSQTAPAWRLVILGGTNDLGAVTVQRSPSGSGGFNNVPLGSEGLVISNGLVRMTSLDVGGNGGNSWLTTLVAGGDVTNTGAMTVRGITTGRASRFLQTGGFFESMGADVLLRGHTNPANNSLVWYWVTGGTNIVRGFALSSLGDTNGTVLISNSAKIYIGSGGIVNGGGVLASSGTNVLLNNNGIFGAQADWTGTVAITLAGGSFDAAALDGTPRNITLSGIVRGSGALNKNGGGTLTLGATNIYTGNTFINAGTLALGPTGSVPNSPQIITSSNTVFDVSAVSGGFTLGDGRTIGGFGVVTGNVTLASGAIINPGNSPGTLTLTNDVSASGGGVFHFDLSTNPSGPSNDFAIVGGTLAVSGLNNIEVSGAGSPGTVYPLIRYGTFSGTTANFDVVGATGIISNNNTTKTLYLAVQSTSRGPTNIVWSGLASQGTGDLWDTEVTTNWVTEAGGTPTIFIPNDHAKFVTAGGGIQTNITLVGTLSPGSGSVTVNSTADYTFTGNGRIGGAGGLTKTNTGTLTVLTTNSYSGPTIIGGGVLVAPVIEDSAVSSSIGAAPFESTNLVLAGGTLRYPGTSVSTDRGATVSGVGGAIDVTNTSTILTISGPIAGDGVLTKAGAGTLTLSGANSYSGGTVIVSGTNRLNTTTAAGTNVITLSGGTLLLAASADSTFPNGLNVTTTSGLTMGPSNNRLDGPMSGSAMLNVSIATSNSVFTLNGDLTNYTGTFNLGDSIGTFRFNSGGGNTTFGSPNATINLGTSNASLQARNAGTMAVGALLGGPGTFVRGQGAGSGNLLWEIGAKNLDTTYEGTILNTSGGATASINKIGSGTLRLTGTNTYTGSTTITSGKLQLDGELGNTLINVDGGTLSGNGIIAGFVLLNPGGTLAPGASVGTLTITNSLDIAGTVAIDVNKSLSQSNDIINVINIGLLNASGGTVTVTNLGPSLQAGDKFFIFNQTVGGGGVLTVTGAGCTWQNDLETDGSITVLTAPPVVNPVIGNVVKSGNNLVFSGSNGPTSGNFIVLNSTNVALPVASWNPIATNPFNPNGTFGFTNLINTSIQKTFFRIQVQ